MTDIDYDDPQVEKEWCAERRAEVIDYLSREGLEHGSVPEVPEWFVAPYVSIWPIHCVGTPKSVEWWVICGDMPTDYVSANGVNGPQEVMHSIAKRWSEVSAYMLRGEPHPQIEIGGPESWPELGPLLQSRALTLAGWANDPEVWDAEA